MMIGGTGAVATKKGDNIVCSNYNENKIFNRININYFSLQIYDVTCQNI